MNFEIAFLNLKERYPPENPISQVVFRKIESKAKRILILHAMGNSLIEIGKKMSKKDSEGQGFYDWIEGQILIENSIQIIELQTSLDIASIILKEIKKLYTKSESNRTKKQRTQKFLKRNK